MRPEARKEIDSDLASVRAFVEEERERSPKLAEALMRLQAAIFIVSNVVEQQEQAPNDFVSLMNEVNALRQVYGAVLVLRRMIRDGHVTSLDDELVTGLFEDADRVQAVLGMGGAK